MRQARFIILDTNGEYRTAIQRQNEDKSWTDADAAFKALYIPTDSAEKGKLAIPYWFMDSEDFVRLFRASPGVQRPVLLNALSSARDSEGGAENWLHVRENIIKECNRILGLCSGTETKDAKSIRQLCDGFLIYIAEQTIDQQLSLLSEHYPSITASGIRTTLEGIKDVAREGIRSEGNNTRPMQP